MTRFFLINFLFWFLSVSLGGLLAQTDSSFEDQFFDDIEIDSDDESFKSSVELSKAEEDSVSRTFDISGSVSQGAIVGLGDPSDHFQREAKGVESVKTEIFLLSQGKHSENMKSKISAVVEYEWGGWENGSYSFEASQKALEVRDLFLDISHESGVWIRVGNQIIARSQLDSLKITDVVNPLDLSTPGLVDLKDLRIHVPAILLSTPLRSANLELVVIYDGGGNKNAPSGSSFDFANSILNQQGLYSETADDEPQNKFEAVGRLNYRLNGGDLSLTIADVNWDSLTPRLLEIHGEVATIKQGYDRVKVLGLSGNLVRSDYLFKYEIALHDGRVFQRDLYTALPWSPHKQIVSGVGIEYNGISDIVLSGEISNTYMLDHNDSLFNSEFETGYILQARWTGLNDIVSVNGAYSKLTGDDSSIYTLFFEYDLTDNLKFDSQIALYDASSQNDFLFPFKKHDAIKASLKYSF